MFFLKLKVLGIWKIKFCGKAWIYQLHEALLILNPLEQRCKEGHCHSGNVGTQESGCFKDMF